ncbi:MAG: 50S ribosomal protein L6 [Candidatus Dojkabacteria bacterium]
MSRIGKKPITIPQGVTVAITDGGRYGYKQIAVKGPKGELSESFRQGILFEQNGDTIELKKENELKQTRAFFGLFRTLVQNMVDGVTAGYTKELEIVGIGYRAEMQGNKLVMSLGYSHKINFEPPMGIVITVADQVNVKVEGYDKQKVGEIAAKLRSFRKPEPYKGKGVRYKGEKVKKKSTKSAK